MPAKSAVAQCERGDLNPHGCLAHRILNPARLPVPPLSRALGHSSKVLPAQGFAVVRTAGARRPMARYALEVCPAASRRGTGYFLPLDPIEGTAGVVPRWRARYSSRRAAASACTASRRTL